MDQTTQQPGSQQKKSPMLKWAVLLAIIVLIGGLIAYVLSKKTDEFSEISSKTETEEQVPVQTTTPAPGNPAAPVPQTPKPVSSTPTTQKSAYKDGTYSADGQYYAPSGLEPMGVTLTVKNDVVTSVQVAANAQNGTSLRYQQRFAQSVNSAVVGKKLDQIQLDAVSGASLTTGGFMNALQSIQSQARA